MPLRMTANLPSLVRVKPGALARTGLYLRRAGRLRAAVLHSAGLPPTLIAALLDGFAAEGVTADPVLPVASNGFDVARGLLAGLPASAAAVVGLGGGAALDVAKYVAHLAGRPYYAVPGSLSNDGFASPQVSLVLDGRRRSLPASMPTGVVIDTTVCLAAPQVLWWSGVGDLVAKVTAVADWKAAFHRRGEPVDDLAALLSDATVSQFLARPVRDAEGVRSLGTALLLNGIAMELCGSSRPASGSEHLISHALDARSERPRLHGLQVGTATYVCSRLQGGGGHERIAAVLAATGFWNGIRADPLDRAEFLDAVRTGPSIKPDLYTVLSERDCVPEVERMLAADPVLAGCFV